MKLNIHNQCKNFKLTYRKWLSSGADWNSEPNWTINTGIMTSADLTPFLSTFEGVIMYKLERKGDKLPYIWLFVAWKSEGYKEFHVLVHLIEYDEWIDWYKLELKTYYRRYANQLSTYTDSVIDAWLTRDDKVFMTKLELDFTQRNRRDGVLNITISEGVKDKHTKKSIWLDLKT
jgi:hypothetical protein